MPRPTGKDGVVHSADNAVQHAKAPNYTNKGVNCEFSKIEFEPCRAREDQLPESSFPELLFLWKTSM